MKPAGRRIKGSIGEREVVAILDGATIRGRTLTARRVPLSGAMQGFKGDVLVGEMCDCVDREQMFSEVLLPCLRHDHRAEDRIEVKRRAQGFKRIDAWLADNYAVVYRSDRNEWCITLRLTDYAEPREK